MIAHPYTVFYAKKLRKEVKTVENENKKYKEDVSKKSNLEEIRDELYKCIKNYGIKDYAVFLRSKEINEEINKKMRNQINVEFELKVSIDNRVICIESKHYSIMYKNNIIYIGHKIRDNKVLWFKRDNKTFYSTKEAFNYLVNILQFGEENIFIL